MSSLEADFPTLWKVIDRLNEASIPYMLTGSIAVNIYGHSRATNDFDIVIQIHSPDVKKIYNLLHFRHPNHRCNAVR